MRFRQQNLLERDLEGVEAFLDEFEPPQNGEGRSVDINDSGDLVVVRNFPLPDGFDPDFVDVLLLTHRYPDAPPVGIYLLERDNAEVIAQLSLKFNVLSTAAYSAPTVSGYRWICFIYRGNAWRFNSVNVSAGDNLRKFLINFFQQCSTERGHGH